MQKLSREVLAPDAARRKAAWARLTDADGARSGVYQVLFSFGRTDRIGVVRDRIPARILLTLAADMNVPRDRVTAWLGISRSTANRKVKDGDLLSQDESERALGIARLVGQVQKIVAESGESARFDAARWTAQWLAQPNPALGGKMPGDYMDTADGRTLVSGLVAQMQSGAYA